jgi:chromosome segregation ATPase
MVGQLKALEQRKAELHEKVRDLQERDMQKNDCTTVARKEFDKLLAENSQLKAEVARKDHSLRIIDAERDQLQAELDQETEERHRLQQEIEATRVEARRAGKDVDQREYALNDLKTRLSRTES